MENEKAGGYISKIQFNNGETVEIAENDIVIFVGPNNAGKSQSLKDIYSLSEKDIPTVVITNIEIEKSSTPISDVLSRVSVGNNHGNYIEYRYMGRSMGIWSHSDDSFAKGKNYGDYRDLFVANLDTSARLTICNPPQSIRRDDPKNHPIHYAAFDSGYRKWLSESFKKAFGIEITPNTQYGAQIPLCIGAPVKLSGEYEDEQTRQEEYAKILDTYKQAQNQGDGIKSFTGILLYLMIDTYRTFLIDEPESFLHPPQAKIMGEIIGQTLTDKQQAFISTHSEEIVKGLLEVCPDRVKIIRITREDDTNSFSILNNDQFRQLWGDPLLKYSNIMASLFHRSVVLCESDSDCKLYSIIDSHIKQKQGKYSETLFIHCGGKHRIAKIIAALRSLNVVVKVITDIDVLNDENVFKGIIEACEIDYDTIKTDYNNITSNLHSPKEKVSRTEARTSINTILDRLQNSELTSKEIRGIRDAVSTISKWENIKAAGVAAIPSGNATASYKKLDELLKSVGIFIVPVGELECFIKEVGGHGPEWVNNVLEAYPDLDDGVYHSIIQFIDSMGL